MEAGHRYFSILLCFCLVALSSAADISWINGKTGPSQWTITPAGPNDTEVISFSGPLGTYYSNSCVARGYFGGTEQLTIDSGNKEIEIWFQGPGPEICPLIWMPVCGLQGSFGPLEAGNWTFRCTDPNLPFEISFTVSSSSAPRTYYVDKDAPGPLHNGESWQRAFTNLQDALCVAVSGDTILVAEGTYKPDVGGCSIAGDRNASFDISQNLTLFGSYAGYGQPNPNKRDTQTYPTILSGDLNGDDLWGILNKDDNSYHVVTAVSGAAKLDGFVVTAGHADGPIPDSAGGGVYIDSADIMFTNCIIRGNVAGFGGAIASQNNSFPSFINCKIVGNSALIVGGGLFCLDNHINLTNCLIIGNSSYQAEYFGGSAIFNLGGSLKISNCTIMDNSAPEGMAITSMSWLFPVTNFLDISNSILYNGGTEINTNHPGTVSVYSSNILGGWSGTGADNISVDPRIVSPGAWSIEGQYIEGDFHLQGTSPCIDQGDNSLLPADEGDLDLDTNTAETLPFDLDNQQRVQDSIVDMGVYEQEAYTPPEPNYADEFGADIVFYVPTNPPAWPVTLTGSSTLTIRLNFPAVLSLSIAPASAAGGDWTAWFDPDPGVIGPGTVDVTIKIRGENVDISQLAPGLHKLAELHIYVQPVL